MTVPVVGPIPRQGMVSVLDGKRLVAGELCYYLPEKSLDVPVSRVRFNPLESRLNAFVDSIRRTQVRHKCGVDVTSPRRAARMAAIVSSFGISGSKGSALSWATRVSSSRKASESQPHRCQHHGSLVFDMPVDAGAHY